MSSEQVYVDSDFNTPPYSTLVVAIAREDLRHWAVVEVVTEWHGPVHILDDATDLIRGRYSPGFVLLICPEILAAVLRRHPRRWLHLDRSASVFLVESLINLDRVDHYVSTVNSLLVAGLHEGRTLMIIRAARMGMVALPPAILEKLLRNRPRHRSSRLGDGPLSPRVGD